MAGGIDITACYTIRCDQCRVFAELDADEQPVEYHIFSDALAARERVSTLDGWWLRWVDNFPNLLCPECAAELVVPPK